MVVVQRSRHSTEFKAKVALEAIKGQRTMNELAGEYGVHPGQIAQWKRQVLEELPGLFASKRAKEARGEEELKASLYQQIGQLKVELDWLKKKLELPAEAKRSLIEPGQQSLSVVQQCELVGLARSSLYYEPRGVSEGSLLLMRLMDEQYTRTPFYGIRRMTAWLQGQGHRANHKRVARLMEVMGLETIYPKPRTSQPSVENRVYPYLLRDVVVARPDQVWSTDITYIRMARGFVYLVAVLDWYSRYVCVRQSGVAQFDHREWPTVVGRPASSTLSPLSFVPLQRAPETVRLGARLDDVRSVGDAIQERLAQAGLSLIHI